MNRANFIYGIPLWALVVSNAFAQTPVGTSPSSDNNVVLDARSPAPHCAISKDGKVTKNCAPPKLTSSAPGVVVNLSRAPIGEPAKIGARAPDGGAVMKGPGRAPGSVPSNGISPNAVPPHQSLDGRDCGGTGSPGYSARCGTGVEQGTLSRSPPPGEPK